MIAVVVCTRGPRAPVMTLPPQLTSLVYAYLQHPADGVVRGRKTKLTATTEISNMQKNPHVASKKRSTSGLE
jgi:hypothetical protein